MTLKVSNARHSEFHVETDDLFKLCDDENFNMAEIKKLNLRKPKQVESVYDNGGDKTSNRYAIILKDELNHQSFSIGDTPDCDIIMFRKQFTQQISWEQLPNNVQHWVTYRISRLSMRGDYVPRKEE